MADEEFKEAVDIQLDRLNVLMPLAAGYRVELFRSSAWVYSRQFDGSLDTFVESDYRLRDALESAGITSEEWEDLGSALYSSSKSGKEFLETAAAIEAKLIAYLADELEKE